MAPITWFTLRPLPRTGDNSVWDQQSFRVHLSKEQLKVLGLSSGERVKIISSEGFHGYALVWLAYDTTNQGNKPIAKIRDVLREKYGLNLSDTVYFEKPDEFAGPLASVTVRFPANSDVAPKCDSTEYLKRRTGVGLEEADFILPGCAFDVHLKEGVCQNASKLRAIVESIEPQPKESQRFYFDPLSTQLEIANSDPVGATPANPEEILKLGRHGIVALSHHLDTINNQLSILSDPSFEAMDKRDFGSTTFLIHGQEGSGKTLLLERFTESPWRRVARIDENWLATNRKTEGEALAEVFRTARAHQPSLILMDELEALLKEARAMARVLRKELEKIRGTRVVVAAATRNILDIDARLVASLHFKTKLEIFPPTVSQREEIIRERLGPTVMQLNINVAALAERTHGFLARDLCDLCELARYHCIQRIKNSMEAGGTGSSLAEGLESQDWVDQRDIDAVIDQVQGSVLKDSIIEVPKVRWADIAGVDDVRKVLEAIIIRPYKYPDLYVDFNVRKPRKGVLLFGPPGCAKTLIAQAVATESNQNFLAVKGSELIKMYVGESERALRDVFRRARVAKPCIIFFDEIDSIGKSRDRKEDGGLNVVTTLLNEMDGIEALKDVFIVGATNRPDILDSALIRPGRFDAHIHVGLPTEDARRQIFTIHTRGQPLAEDVDFDTLASKSDGSSGAEISGVCGKAVELAMDDLIDHPESKREIHMHHFIQALKMHAPQTDKTVAARFEGWHPGKSLSPDS